MGEIYQYPLQFTLRQILPNTPTQHPDITIFPFHLSDGTDPLPRCPHPHLGVLLGHMLLGELGELYKLGNDLLDVVAVGAVHEDGGHRVQDGLVRGLEARGRGDRREKAERKL